jgi:7-cyano-7-deazaguanine reductase
MVKIEDIASKHLGKAGDGTVVKPYITPDNVDSSLLVGVPRYLNRTQYNIDEYDLPFDGYDTWNCYEFSTLTTNGFPVCGVIRLVYPSSSQAIVESKSLKLYLNSFNMARLADTVADVIDISEVTIQKDVANVLGLSDPLELQVAFLTERSIMVPPISNDMTYPFMSLEHSVGVNSMKFDHYNEDPNILQVVDTVPDVEHNWHSAVLRSNCRVTNQPDWGDVYISIKGELTVTPESLLQYIVSMRRENHFHEEICECIYKRLHDLLKPDNLFVSCLYTRRGGIDINPARASGYLTLMKYSGGLSVAHRLNTKTLRQ